MMARLEEKDANIDIQMAIISLLTQLFASNNKSKMSREFFDPKTRSSLIFYYLYIIFMILLLLLF